MLLRADTTPKSTAMSPSQLQKLLDSTQLSQAEAARQLGLDPRSMRRYISGEVEVPLHVEIALKAIAESWSPTLQLREINARLRHIAELAEKELERIAAGDTEDCRRIARSALKRIIDLRARPFSTV
jgi:hypothetical protein